jgi:hypothetical protein
MTTANNTAQNQAYKIPSMEEEAKGLLQKLREGMSFMTLCSREVALMDKVYWNTWREDFEVPSNFLGHNWKK